MEGLERRATKVWQDLAASEARLGMLRELGKINVGYGDIENFNLGLISKLRSERMRDRGEFETRKVTASSMNIKMRDEQRYNEELVKERLKLRKEIGKKLKNNSKPYRRMIKYLRREAEKVREDHKIKYDEKIENLRRKYKEEDEAKMNKVPDILKEYEALSIFKEADFDNISGGEEEVLVISEGIILSDEEKAVLRLHTKFSVIQMIQENSLEFEQELAYAKIRMERRKDLEETEKRLKEEEEIEPPLLEVPTQIGVAKPDQNLLEEKTTEEREGEEERKEEEEARTRQIFDPISGIYDDRKRRATDLDECARVTLPKPLPVTEEALIELRRGIHAKIHRTFLLDFTKRGEQIENLTEEETRGLRSILKRIRAGELLVIRTDKSGRFCVVSVEDYLKLGEVHVSKDEKIGRLEIIETEKILNSHTVAWCKIWGTGEEHNHSERVMNSKITLSENSADMYFLYKDHKKEPGKTRPVVTGCTSDTRVLSNCVSNFLESVANCSTSDFDSISGEDMLSKTKINNKKVLEVMDKWERRREAKLNRNCEKCNIMEVIKNCSKCDTFHLEREEEEEKLADRIGKTRRENGEESLLPEGWKQQVGAEDLLHPEGRDCSRPILIGLARSDPTLLDRYLGSTR